MFVGLSLPPATLSFFSCEDLQSHLYKTVPTVDTALLSHKTRIGCMQQSVVVISFAYFSSLTNLFSRQHNLHNTHCHDKSNLICIDPNDADDNDYNRYLGCI
jgi:hypothetical protein